MGVLSTDQIKNLFGEFRYRVNSDRSLTILEDWEEENITSVYIPVLDGVQTYGGKFNGRVRFHKKGAEQLSRAFAAVKDAGLGSRILFFDGSFVPRLMRGSTMLSRHSWGTALDLNADWNGFRQKPAARGTRGSLYEIADVVKPFGFSWGGDWSSPDGMHFEINFLKDFSTNEPVPPKSSSEAPPVKLVFNDDPSRVLSCARVDGHAIASRFKLAKLAGIDLEDGETDSQVLVAQYLRSNGWAVLWNAEQQKIYAYKSD